VDVQSRRQRRRYVGNAVGEREADLLGRRRAGLADVIAADADGVPARHLGGAVAEEIGDDAHRRRGGIDVGAAGDVFLEDVVLHRAREPAEVRALLTGDGDVERQQYRGGGVDGHRGGDLVQRNTVEECAHILDAGDGDTYLADFPFGERVVGV